MAFVGASLARLGTGDATVMLGYEQGLLKISVVSTAFVICMYYFDLYDSSILGNRRELLTRLIQVFGTVCIFLAFLYYVYPPLELGRGILAIGLSLGAVMLFFWRRLFLMVNALPQFADRTLIFGDSAITDLLTTELQTRPELGMRIVGQLKCPENSTGRQAGVSYEEEVEALLSSVQPYKPDRVIVAFSERRGKVARRGFATAERLWRDNSGRHRFVRGNNGKSSHRGAARKLFVILSLVSNFAAPINL